MGYSTSYKIKMINGELAPFETEAMSRGYFNLEQLIAKEFDGYNPFNEACKWYDHDNDMTRFSKKHPEALFELSGEGEESGDVWRKYYKNGKSASIIPTVVWPTFDESMLS